jgi:hypothetical protein
MKITTILLALSLLACHHKPVSSSAAVTVEIARAKERFGYIINSKDSSVFDTATGEWREPYWVGSSRVPVPNTRSTKKPSVILEGWRESVNGKDGVKFRMDTLPIENDTSVDVGALSDKIIKAWQGSPQQVSPGILVEGSGWVSKLPDELLKDDTLSVQIATPHGDDHLDDLELTVIIGISHSPLIVGITRTCTAWQDDSGAPLHITPRRSDTLLAKRQMGNFLGE